MKHQTQRRTNLILAAALSALPILAATAHAQYRVGDDGRANDANNRLGSGGYNSGRDASQRPYSSFGNQIVTGNSTGLSYFHGNSQVTDPLEFRGSTATGASDHFLAVSGPVNYAQRSTGQSQYQPYYSTARLAAPPPPGFQETPGGAGLVPAPPITNQPNDTRLGIINSAEVDTTQLPPAGVGDWAGPVDPSATAAITASPLTGVRSLNADDPTGASYMSRVNSVRPDTPGDRARLDNVQVARLRAELNDTMVTPDGQPLDNTAGPQQIGVPPTAAQQRGQQRGGAQPGANNGAGAVDLTQAQAMSSGQNLTANATLTPQALNPSVNNSVINNGAANQQQGITQRMLIAPEEQSAQLAELQRRYQQSHGQMNAQEANQLYNKEVAAKNEAEQNPPTDNPQANKTATAGGATGAGANTSVPPPPVGPDYAKANQDIMKKAQEPLNPVLKGPLNQNGNQPYVITSLATGIKAKGLSDLMKQAEEQMRQGKFTNALDTYDSAQQVAPNNPLIALGRGFAELGASYYGKAEGDLRRGIFAAPAVLVGQYDLKGFLGEDRLKFVVKDLKDILKTEKTERPAFLLAYIFHNVGDDESTAKYLDEADRRVAGRDGMVNLMRNTWGLKKSDTPATPANP
ncbi:MAG TPA: hypothetical protein VLI90_20645 [Tepidisphaeraceae bacterium]|nr:hypothetical protein [Tepidisphaeraceae bacterium]